MSRLTTCSGAATVVTCAFLVHQTSQQMTSATTGSFTDSRPCPCSVILRDNRSQAQGLPITHGKGSRQPRQATATSPRSIRFDHIRHLTKKVTNWYKTFAHHPAPVPPKQTAKNTLHSSSHLFQLRASPHTPIRSFSVIASYRSAGAGNGHYVIIKNACGIRLQRG